MDMTGEYRIAAPRAQVWQALNDPDILRQCIPGCEELEKLSATEFTAKARLKVGPVSARFTGRVELSDLDPPAGYRITGEGQGGAAGFGKGGATVRLVEDGPDATLLSYTAQAQVGGKLAQVGSRLVQGAAKKMADDFFAEFSRLVGCSQDVSGTAPADQAQAGSAPDPGDPMLHTTDTAGDGISVPPAPALAPFPEPRADAAAGSPGLPPAVWITGLVVLLALALWAIL